jgi:outer membrane lipoprotein-sorting protein
MMFFSSRCLITVMAVLVAGAGAQAAEPAIIAKARAFLGTDAALDAVKSVHYKGAVISVDPNDPSKQTRSEIEIIAQKPDRQRVVAQSDKAIETTVLDGYEGWQRTQEIANPKNRRMVVFRPDAVRRLRAQAWENLSFFRGIETVGGRVEEQGTKAIDGVECVKVAFIYTPTIIFYRYFDPATGRLVQTETEDGGSTREEGENVVKGVRFPQRMKMTMRGAGGQTQTVTVIFESITLNETFGAELFRMPSPGSE